MLEIAHDHSIDALVVRLDPRDREIDELDRRDALVCERRDELGGTAIFEIAQRTWFGRVCGNRLAPRDQRSCCRGSGPSDELAPIWFDCHRAKPLMCRDADPDPWPGSTQPSTPSHACRDHPVFTA
jgi:hypothetical protein